MARKAVVEVQCDRCTRTEHREVSEADKRGNIAFDASMNGVEMHVSFDDLCTPCMKTVKNHLEQIGKKIDGLSPDRKPTDIPPKDES
jgi:hypothetical protein